MKKQKARFRSLQSKLTVSSTAVIFIMVVLLEVCVYTAATQLQLKDAMQLNTELMQTMGNSFDNSVESFKRQINFITMNPTMQDTLRTPPETPEQALLYGNTLRTSIVTNMLALSEVDGVYLYDENEQLLTFWQKKYRKGDPYIVLPIMDSTCFSANGSITSSHKNGKLMYHRTIRDMKTLDLLGYISFIYDNDALLKSIDTIAPNPNRFVAVFDEHGNVLAHNSESTERLQTIVDQNDLTTVPSNTFLQLEGIDSALICRYESRTPGWSLVCVVDKNQLLRSSELTLLLVFCFGVAGVAFAALVQALWARRIVRPLHQMVKTVRHVEQGDYTVKAEVHTHDEVELLADSFNHMIDKIDILVNQNLRSEIKYRDMQLMALQAQIDPHFLYNTLECINCLAQLGRKEEVRKVTLAFSSLMKSLAKGPKMVCVSEELGYTQDFLVIYKALLGDKLHTTIESEPQYDNVQIPRLIIQPLVENAVLHGIKPSVCGGHVSVNVSSAPQGILISILDDGVGMPPAMVQAIANYSAQLHTPEELGRIGVGVRNAIDRLRLVYGQAAHFCVQSSEEWGTIVDITLPCEKEAKP